MRIAIITTGFAAHETDYGGAAAILNIVKRLSENSDLNITVFSLYYPIDRPCYEIDNIRVYSFAETDSPGKTAKLMIWRDCKESFRDEHKHKPFDIIHAMWAGESGHVAAALSREFNIPLAANINGGELGEIKPIKFGSRLKKFQKHFVNKTLEQASAIVCGSDFISSLVKKYYGEEIFAKVKKIPFGINPEMFYPEKKEFSKAAPILINIANAAAVKSHETLFKAFKIVLGKYPAAVLNCFGRDDNSMLPALAKKCGVETNVELKGFADYEHIPKALHGADIFVLSSLYESQNMAIIEAAFCGLPVVSTNVGCANEITPNTVEPGNVEALAGKILEVISNPVQNYPDIKDKFSLENSAKRFYGLYKSLL